jgi:hypothetical protein
MSASAAAIEDAYTDAILFKTICQIRGDDVDDTGAHELAHRICGTATPDEQALGSFTPCKLKQLPIWDLWLPSEWKPLDAHQKQKVLGVPCPAPSGATVLRSHWNYIIHRRCIHTRKPTMRYAHHNLVFYSLTGSFVLFL